MTEPIDSIPTIEYSLETQVVVFRISGKKQYYVAPERWTNDVSLIDLLDSQENALWADDISLASLFDSREDALKSFGRNALPYSSELQFPQIAVEEVFLHKEYGHENHLV